MVDPYQILGVTPDASPEELREAYRAAVQIFHPDRFEGMPPNVRATAERRMQEVTRAWSEIKAMDRVASEAQSGAQNAPARFIRCTHCGQTFAVTSATSVTCPICHHNPHGQSSGTRAQTDSRQIWVHAAAHFNSPAGSSPGLRPLVQQEPVAGRRAPECKVCGDGTRHSDWIVRCDSCKQLNRVTLPQQGAVRCSSCRADLTYPSRI